MPIESLKSRDLDAVNDKSTAAATILLSSTRLVSSMACFHFNLDSSDSSGRCRAVTVRYSSSSSLMGAAACAARLAFEAMDQMLSAKALCGRLAEVTCCAPSPGPYPWLA